MSCCCNTTRAVVANSAVTSATANPVVLTLDNPLPVGCCFDLCISKGLLVNCSPNPVNITDGSVTYELFDQCADLVRYDQLICAAKAGRCKMDVCGTLCLRCIVRSEAETPRVLVKRILPESSYAPVTAAAPTRFA